MSANAGPYWSLLTDLRRVTGELGEAEAALQTLILAKADDMTHTRRLEAALRKCVQELELLQVGKMATQDQEDALSAAREALNV